MGLTYMYKYAYTLLYYLSPSNKKSKLPLVCTHYSGLNFDFDHAFANNVLTAGHVVKTETNDKLNNEAFNFFCTDMIDQKL